MKFILLHIWFTVNPNQVWLWDRIFFPRSVRVDCFEDGKTQPGHNGHHCSQILNHFLTLPEPWDLLNTGSWVTNNCIITGYNNRAHWKLGEVILNFTLWCLFLFTSHSSPESHRREGSFLSQCTCKKCTQCYVAEESAMQRRVTFGAVKARLYDAPGATKVTVAGEGRETLAPSSAELSQNPQKLLLWFATPRISTESKPSDERWKSNKGRLNQLDICTWFQKSKT